jgi:signal transduction histidine kinase
MAATESASGDPVRQGPDKRSPWRRFCCYARTLAAPGLIWLLLLGALAPPLLGWLHSEEHYDRAALREWLEESRNPNKTLGQLAEEYQERVHTYLARQKVDREDKVILARDQVKKKREEIFEHLRALGDPAMKMYQGLLLMFPQVYRLEVSFDLGDVPIKEKLWEDGPELGAPVIWDSGENTSGARYPEESFPLGTAGKVTIRYQLHALNKRQREEQRKARRLRQLSLLAVAATGLGLAWLLLVQSDERERERQRRLAQEKIAQAERQLMQEERRHAETERKLLEQRLATQAAERQALELKSHLYASIGIMAGSYAHNIKNLLVRPNDLLRRCLESQDVPAEQERMLLEVQQTLGTVTERLQQILHTVRRDPSQYHSTCIDLNVVMRGLMRTWSEMAAERWQLDLALDLADSPVLVSGDVSHLQQAVENLLFNARDATFEMRNHHRDSARRMAGVDPGARRQALIQAAAWRGKVVLRTRRAVAPAGEESILEVSDNGAGMPEEVLKRCTETHFSTKRDNALFEGHSTGMGLGLSFVVTILEHHQGKLEIESAPLRGTTFRARLPAALLAEAKEADGSCR